MNIFTESVTIVRCARCQKTHNALPMRKLNNAPDDYDHFAICPETDQPILITVTQINDEIEA